MNKTEFVVQAKYNYISDPWGDLYYFDESQKALDYYNSLINRENKNISYRVGLKKTTYKIVKES